MLHGCCCDFRPDLAVPSPSSNAARQPTVHAAALLAQSVELSDEELDRIAEEALRRVVFHAIGDTIMQLYAPLHADKDAALLKAHASLWAITCNQVRTFEGLKNTYISRFHDSACFP